MDDTVVVEDVLSSSGSSVEMVEGEDDYDVGKEETHDPVIFVVHRSHIYGAVFMAIAIVASVLWYCYHNLTALRDVRTNTWVLSLQRQGQYLLDYDKRQMYDIELVSETPGEETLISSVYEVFQKLQKYIRPRLHRGVQATRHTASEYYSRLKNKRTY